MAISNGYCTLAELQQWNSATATGAQAILERAIEAASRAIDQYCNRHFWQATTTARTLDTCDPWLLKLNPFYDLVSIDSNGLKTDQGGDGTFETTWATTDYQLLPLNAAAAPEAKPYRQVAAIGSRTFPPPIAGYGRRRGLIQITGTWGWPAIPVDVTQACLMLAARYFTRKESPHGIAGVGDFGGIRVTRTDPDVMAMLDPYRRTSVLVA